MHVSDSEARTARLVGKDRWTRRELNRLRKDQLEARIKKRAQSLSSQTDKERITKVAKISTQTFDLLRDGQYILKIAHISDAENSEYAGDPQIQVMGTLEVVEVLTPGTETMTDDETEAVGHTYDEWWKLDPYSGAVKKNSKLWQIYEAATGMKLDVDDEIDTDDMIGKTFQAKVVVNKPGTRNRTEYDSFGKANKKSRERVKKAEEEVEVTEKEFNDIPF